MYQCSSTASAPSPTHCAFVGCVRPDQGILELAQQAKERYKYLVNVIAELFDSKQQQPSWDVKIDYLTVITLADNMVACNAEAPGPAVQCC